MRRILFLCAIALLSLFSFYGCDDENKILNDEEVKPAADSVKISIVLNCDSLLLYAGDVDTLIATVRNGDKIVDYKVSWSTDGAQVAAVDSNGVVTALSVGTAVISVKYKDVIYTCKVVVTERPEKYEYVDLGLSVLWATCNVGAEKPEDYGDYYPWGEVEVKDNNSWSSYKWCNGSNNTLTKYNYYSWAGTVDNKTTLEPEDDVAHVLWGGDWRMPTMAEHNEIYNNCTWTWYGRGNSEFNGVAGYKVTSNIEGFTDRSIFLPVAGYALKASFTSVGSIGYYWYSTLDTEYPDFAYSLRLSQESVSWRSSGRRDIGSSVRPVCPSEEWLSSVNISFVEDSKKMIVGGKAELNVSVKQNDVVQSNPPVVWSSDNPSVAVVDVYGYVKALSIGTAHITASIQSISTQCTVKVVDESELEHEYVDLGLSVKWATCNVGATQPEESGNRFAWGETESKSRYDLTNYKFYLSGSYEDCDLLFSKYITDDTLGIVDNKTTLDLEDDVAHVKWGGSWRMPTEAEQKELRESCTWTWTTEEGVHGYRVTSNKPGFTDKSIFLPTNYNVAPYYFGYYWSSSLGSFITEDTGTYDYNSLYGGMISFGSDFVELDATQRESGYGGVRPVCP